MSIRQACVLFSISQSVFYYEPQPNNDGEIVDHLANLAELHKSWGFRMMYYHLRLMDWPFRINLLCTDL